jgi:hypothetical protein
MMTQATQHTPTPWHVNKDDPAAIFNSMGGYVTRIDGNAVQTRAAIEANAAHIVRCVNAHDELVAALNTAVQCMELEARMINPSAAEAWAHPIKQARAALAKVQK